TPPVAQRPAPRRSVVVQLGMDSRESFQGSGDPPVEFALARAEQADEMHDLRLRESLGVRVAGAPALRHRRDILARVATVNGRREVYRKSPPVDQGKKFIARKKDSLERAKFV